MTSPDQTTRRAFMGAGAAALTLGSGSARAGEAAVARKVVRVAGRPAKVIDVHGHCAFKEVEPVVAGTPLATTIAPLVIFGPQRIAEMDRRGIDLQVLTVNFYWWYPADEALAERIVRTHDEGLARLASAYPGRVVGLSSVALQYPEMAARQLEHAVRNLGLKGASIGGHVAGEAPTTARYDPFWAKCQELDVPVFMHPNSAGNIARDGAWTGRGGVDNIIGNPLETTLFLSRMIYDGVLDRFPRLKLGAAHGGGYMPSYLGRSDAACVRAGADCANVKPPSAYFKDQIFVDSMVFSENGLRHLVDEVGAGQIVYGSDLPYVWPDTIDLIANMRSLTAGQKTAMLGGNLTRMLKL
jgi:aminocarboxymuconate-semialdehyde decarboxylase